MCFWGAWAVSRWRWGGVKLTPTYCFINTSPAPWQPAFLILLLTLSPSVLDAVFLVRWRAARTSTNGLLRSRSHRVSNVPQVPHFPNESRLKLLYQERSASRRHDVMNNTRSHLILPDNARQCWWWWWWWWELVAECNWQHFLEYCAWIFPFSATSYLCYTTFCKSVLNLLLHYTYVTTLVTSYLLVRLLVTYNN